MVVTVGAAVTGVPVVAERPVAGSQVYVSGASPVVPAAEREVLLPVHIVAFAETTGNGPEALLIPENIVATVEVTAPDVSVCALSAPNFIHGNTPAYSPIAIFDSVLPVWISPGT